MTVNFYVLVLSWYMGFDAIWSVAFLLHKRFIGSSTCTLNSFSRPWIPYQLWRPSHALYSALVVLLEIVLFFDLQDINDSSNFTQYLVTDLLVTEHDVQSTLQYVDTFPEGLLLINSPRPGWPFMYFTTRIAASICDSFGLCMNSLSHSTANDMSDLVMVKYNNLLISLDSLSYPSVLSSCIPKHLSNSALVSFWFFCKGVASGLVPSRPHYEMSFKSIFSLIIRIPLPDLANSSPRKYLNSPRFFILKFWLCALIASWIRFALLSVIKRSSMYTKIITISFSYLLVKRE